MIEEPQDEPRQRQRSGLGALGMAKRLPKTAGVSGPRWTPCGHQSGRAKGRLAAAFS
jgi:hypothetical protein